MIYTQVTKNTSSLGFNEIILPTLTHNLIKYMMTD